MILKFILLQKFTYVMQIVQLNFVREQKSISEFQLASKIERRTRKLSTVLSTNVATSNTGAAMVRPSFSSVIVCLSPTAVLVPPHPGESPDFMTSLCHHPDPPGALGPLDPTVEPCDPIDP
jgi:hypothetical protein